MQICDFHTHTLYSDGELLPVEQARRAQVNGCTAIALTDHVGMGNYATVLQAVLADCELIQRYWDIIAIPGVEVTHVPAAAVGEVAKKAKEAGAVIVLVHGETTAEPVEPGTNLAAIQSPHVDVLAHPGLIKLEEAAMAAANGTFLELSCRRGHSLTNGHVLKIARAAGAKLLVNTDSHAPDDLLTEAMALKVARGAGLDEGELEEVLVRNPRLLLQRLGLAK